MSKNMIIVSDAGPLIGLAKIRKLNILNRLFEKVKIPPSVCHELRITSSGPETIEFKESIEITKWIEVSDPVNIPHILPDVIEQGDRYQVELDIAQ